MTHILLIEDDLALGRGVALSLAGEDREIQVACSLAEGRMYWKQRGWALIVLDVNLPDGSGLDFLQEVRQTSAVPVLILTANDLERERASNCLKQSSVCCGCWWNTGDKP